MKIAFIADSQLGKRLYGLSDTFNDWLAAFCKAIDVSIRNKVDYVIFLGDTFDSEAMYPIEVFTAQKQVELLHQANIKTFGILGNHDKGQSDIKQDIISWLTVCNIAHMNWSKPILLKDKKGTFSLIGIHHQNKNLLSQTLSNLKQPENASRHFLCMHQALKELGAIAMGWEFETQQIPSWVSRVFIGDFHNACQFQDKQGRIFQYPGSIETVSFNQETEPGFIIYETETDTFEHFSTKQRDYIKIVQRELPANWEAYIAEKVESAVKTFNNKPVIQLICDGNIDEKTRLYCEGLALKVLPMEVPSIATTQTTGEDSGPVSREQVIKLTNDLLPQTELGDLGRRLILNPDKSQLRDWQNKHYPQASILE